MILTNYEGSDLERVDAFLRNHSDMNEKTLESLLKTCNVSFVLEGINRIQSTMICEQKDSYVQQSQRYVAVSADGYTLPKELDEQDRVKGVALLEKVFALYQEMSTLKGEFKGRPKPENYLYGIPVEDARYLLPLAVKTNISVATTGDKLMNWFRMMRRPEDQILFAEIKEALLEKLPATLGQWLDSFPFMEEDSRLIDFYEDDLSRISPEQPVVLLRAFHNPLLKAGLGALTSTNADAPSVVLTNWGGEAEEKAKGVVNRVMGYGHTSIAEQYRTTFGMMFSLVTYHQMERHRLPNTYREDWNHLLADENRPPVIPPTVIAGGFRDRYLAIVAEVQAFQRDLAQRYEGGIWRYFLLNCQQLKLISSTNARMDCGILQERICNNAQWEIHNISVEKLEQLRTQSDILYRTAVPSCVYGSCKEGKLTCGRAAEMREKYRVE